MALDTLIAIGRTAEIYAWGRDQVLKLFYEWFSVDDVHYEARIARAVHQAGLAVPGVGEIVEVDGRLGLEYERIAGIPMWKRMVARPWGILAQARLLADLHTRIHAIRGIEGLPSQRERLVSKIEAARALSAAQRQAALQALERAPQGDRLCHGDFHPGNIVLTHKGPVVIDWIDATTGNPLADVARTSILVEGERTAGKSMSWMAKAGFGWAHRAYLRQYFRLKPEGTEEYRAWLPIVAAGRLSEGIEELEGWLRTQAESGLVKARTRHRYR